MELVQTVEDVNVIWEANKEVKRLQIVFFSGLKESPEESVKASREIDKLRRYIHGKYKILL